MKLSKDGNVNVRSINPLEKIGQKSILFQAQTRSLNSKSLETGISCHHHHHRRRRRRHHLWAQPKVKKKLLLGSQKLHVGPPPSDASFSPVTYF